jgi:uroporphyrinogen decarboxylase
MENTQMTRKECLQAILAGKPAGPIPHFELVFYLEEEAFGIRLMNWDEWSNATDSEREADLRKQVEIKARLVGEYCWAAVQGPTGLLKKELGTQALVYDFNGEGTFWMPTGDKIMDFVVMMFEHPEEMHELARQKCKASIELAKRQRDEGVDFIVINSDYGFNSGPFISPKHFSEFVTPYLAEIVQAMHELGLPAILHSDGNLNGILDQLVNTGLDGYQSIDPQGGMDIKAVREAYPDLILMGNVQCSLLQDADECAIRENVRYSFKHGSVGGRYIFSTSNCIYKGMPLENYRIMLDEYEKCCHEMSDTELV